MIVALNEALQRTGKEYHEIVVVTDIGCIGLADRFFKTNAFHGLHGRAVTYATGLKLANPDLEVIVLMGDGGCGIGGTHIVNAARRNIGITLLVCNNLNYGMTGYQHSVTTPHGGLTKTSPVGNIETPLDVCKLAAAGNADWVGRIIITNTPQNKKELSDHIQGAINHDGFSILDIMELCPSGYGRINNVSNGSEFQEAVTKLGLKAGVLQNWNREEFSKEYRTRLFDPLFTLELENSDYLGEEVGMIGAGRTQVMKTGEVKTGDVKTGAMKTWLMEQFKLNNHSLSGDVTLSMITETMWKIADKHREYTIEANGNILYVNQNISIDLSPLEKCQSGLDSPVRIVIAGSAGQAIQTAAQIFASGAILSGLFATQRGTYPITTHSGYSIAEIIISPENIDYSGIEEPDYMVITSKDGFKGVVSGGWLSKLTTDSRVIAINQLRGEFQKALNFNPEIHSFPQDDMKKQQIPISAFAQMVEAFDLYPVDSLRTACEKVYPHFIEEHRQDN